MLASIDAFNQQFEGKSAQDIVEFFIKLMGQDILLASSLGAEDQVLTHMALKASQSARIMVLDTGRLHPETYLVMAQTQKQYQMTHEVYFPNAHDVETMVRDKGINLMYDSIDNRKECCHIRKVEPLKRALSTCKAWITGLRKAQAITRTDMKVVEWDDAHGIIKINPLANWSEEEVWAYIKTHHIPYNSLHDQRFPSIGCAPCTRAIKPGEDIRAGRWWWEEAIQKECGLHIKDGKIIRPNKDTQ